MGVIQIRLLGIKQIIIVNRYRLLTHTYDAAVSAVQRSLVNYAVLFDLTTIRRSTLFYFQRMNDIVFLDENINLFCVRITKIGNIYFRFSVSVVFHKLHYHIIFVVMTACSTVTESVCRQPHRKVSTKTGVTEIQFRCFAEPFQFIV